MNHEHPGRVEIAHISQNFAEQAKKTAGIFRAMGDALAKTMEAGHWRKIGQLMDSQVWAMDLFGTCPVCLKRRPIDSRTLTMKRHLRRLKGRRDSLKCKGKGRRPVEVSVIK